MIIGAHTILYAPDAGAARAFFRDVLGFPAVDAGQGWLIFSLPPGELAAHPLYDPGEATRHELYLMCDDIHATVATLKGRGVEFVSGVSNEGWGLLTRLRIPGGGEIGLYEPRHPRPPAAGTRKAPARPKKAARKRAEPPMRRAKPAGRKPARKKKPARR